jgi:hypothetical protein
MAGMDTLLEQRGPGGVCPPAAAAAASNAQRHAQHLDDMAEHRVAAFVGASEKNFSKEAIQDMPLGHVAPDGDCTPLAATWNAIAGETPGSSWAQQGVSEGVGQRCSSSLPEAHQESRSSRNSQSVGEACGVVSKRISFESQLGAGIADGVDLDPLGGFGPSIDIMSSIAEESEINIVGTEGEEASKAENETNEAHVGAVRMAGRQLKAWSGRPTTPLQQPQPRDVSKLSHSIDLQDGDGPTGQHRDVSSLSNSIDLQDGDGPTSHPLDASEDGPAGAGGPELWQDGRVVHLERRDSGAVDGPVPGDAHAGHAEPPRRGTGTANAQGGHAKPLYSETNAHSEHARPPCGGPEAVGATADDADGDGTAPPASPRSATWDAGDNSLESKGLASPQVAIRGFGSTSTPPSVARAAEAQAFDVHAKGPVADRGGVTTLQDPSVLASLLQGLPGETSLDSGKLRLDVGAVSSSDKAPRNTEQYQFDDISDNGALEAQDGVQPPEIAAEVAGCASRGF